MHAFHIIEVMVQLFPDPSGPLESYRADLSEFLGRYFPIHFTHVRKAFTHFTSCSNDFLLTMHARIM